MPAREATFADPLEKAIRRYEHAAEQSLKVVHYVDRDAMGRAPTDAEMKEFQERNTAASKALHSVGSTPCPDFRTLRRKAKFLVHYQQHQSLGAGNVHVFVESILQMPRKSDVC